jgi:hypothetical protein
VFTLSEASLIPHNLKSRDNAFINENNRYISWRMFKTLNKFLLNLNCLTEAKDCAIMSMRPLACPPQVKGRFFLVIYRKENNRYVRTFYPNRRS